MSTYAVRVLAVCSLLSCALGCGATTSVAPGPDAREVRAEPRRFVLLPITTEGFTVDGHSETAWMASQHEMDRARWSQDRIEMAGELAELMHDDRSRFEAASSAPPLDGTFLHINLDAYEHGQLRFTVRATDRNGDEVLPPVRLATRRRSHTSIHAANRSLLLQAASAVAQLVTSERITRSSNARTAVLPAGH